MNNEALYMLLNDDLKKNNTEKEKKIEFYLTHKYDYSGALSLPGDFGRYCEYVESGGKLNTIFDCDITVPGSSSNYDAKIVRILTFHCLYSSNHYFGSVIFYINPTTNKLDAFSIDYYLNYGGYFIEKRDDNKIHIICYGFSNYNSSSSNVSYIFDYEIKNNSGKLSAPSYTTIQTSPSNPTYSNLYNNFFNKSGRLVSRFIMTSTHMYLYDSVGNMVYGHSRNRTDAASDWQAIGSSSKHPGTNYASPSKHRIKIVHDETNNETYEYFVSYSAIGSRYIINAIELVKSYYIDNNKKSSTILRITDDSYFNKLSYTDTYGISAMIEVSVDHDNIENSYIFIEPNVNVTGLIHYNVCLSDLPIRVVYKIEGDKWYKLNRDYIDLLYTGEGSTGGNYYMSPATRRSMEYLPIVINSDTSRVIAVKSTSDSSFSAETLYYEEKEV